MQQPRFSQFSLWLHRIHILLGLLVSLPVLAWSLSGLLLALPPGSISGEPYRTIEFSRVKVTPREAATILSEHTGSTRFTALTLEQRGDDLRYSAFASDGAYRVNAMNGEVTKPEPPSARTRWIRQAHFFNFAGSSRTALLMGFCLLTALSTLSGLALLALWIRRRRFLS